MNQYEEIEIIETFPSGKVKTTKIKRTIKQESSLSYQSIYSKSGMPAFNGNDEEMIAKIKERFKRRREELLKNIRRNNGTCEYYKNGNKYECTVKDNKIIAFDENGTKRCEMDINTIYNKPKKSKRSKNDKA